MCLQIALTTYNHNPQRRERCWKSRSPEHALELTMTVRRLSSSYIMSMDVEQRPQRRHSMYMPSVVGAFARLASDTWKRKRDLVDRTVAISGLAAPRRHLCRNWRNSVSTVATPRWSSHTSEEWSEICVDWAEESLRQGVRRRGWSAKPAGLSMFK